MERDVEKELWLWMKRSDRCPLIVRGARQVGKSYLIESFGGKAFEKCIVVNFELYPELCHAFDSLDPAVIVKKLNILLRNTIVPDKTLLFFDEIQQCPRALMALRYFKEQLPTLHVIAAGSLLEFALEKEDFSFPVGRVEFLYLRPMSFLETVRALGEEQLVEEMRTWTIESPPDPVFHKRCLDLIRHYLFTGGMPAVVNLYKEEQNLLSCERRQAALVKTYRDDFGKYARNFQHKYLQRVFERAPFLAGKQFQYAKIDKEMRSRDLKAALDQLVHAGLIHLVYATSANGVPLRAEINEKKFKLLFLDVGLLQFSLGNLGSEILESDALEIHRGALAEQLVGQELLAYTDPYQERYLHYWHKEKRSSSAEVDYVVNISGKIIPIEVKAGATGRLRSLRQIMETKHLPLGIQISQNPLELHDGILSVPLYMTHALPRLLQEADHISNK